eukprot:COSAG02_NODE_11301_length_1752_cov_1.636419_2_plen_46_part_00
MGGGVVIYGNRAEVGPEVVTSARCDATRVSIKTKASETSDREGSA